MPEHVVYLTVEQVRGIRDGKIKALVTPIAPQPECDLPGAYFDAYNGGPQWNWWTADNKVCNNHGMAVCPYGVPGDVLLGKEPWGALWPDGCDDGMVEEGGRYRPIRLDECIIEYKADTDDPRPGGWPTDEPDGPCWKSGAIMPRWAVRLRLVVQDARAVRLWDLKEAQILTLGVEIARIPERRMVTMYPGYSDDRAQRALAPWWDRGHAPEWVWAYKHNPWVWYAEIEKGA